ncbi:RNA polymerase III-inhibiting protein maf1 [Blyttiomyces sp. JEL0837]|nr:RNA polymerase III-inhibiting protein maf1 [Blyttiomyces sp. JEL0837]
MKYLEYECLEEVNTALSCVDTGDMRVFSRLEAYSCKNTKDDRKLKHHIESKYGDDMGIPGSPDHPSTLLATTSIPTSSSYNNNNSSNNHQQQQQYLSTSSSSFPGTTPTIVSPFGPLTQPTSRKTLFYLLATLNSAFPDYDFSDVKPEYFVKMPSLGLIVNNVNSTLFGIGSEALSLQINAKVWQAIDEVVQLDECDFYSFNPDPDIEPDSEEGNLWSFYFFFFNRKLKRMVFFTSRAVSFMAPVQPEEAEMTGDLEMESSYYGSEMGLSYEQYTMQAMEV